MTAPKKIIASRPENSAPKRIPNNWYDRSLTKLKNKKERLYKDFLFNRTTANKRAHDKQKYIYEKKLMDKKNEFKTSLFLKYKGDIRKTWSLVNRLLGKSKARVCQSLKIDDSLVTDPKTLSNEFNKYFSKIAETMKANLPPARKNYRQYLPPSSTRRSIYFWPTDPNEVKEIIMSSK